jgi:hypothetical protein
MYTFIYAHVCITYFYFFESLISLLKCVAH